MQRRFGPRQDNERSRSRHRFEAQESVITSVLRDSNESFLKAHLQGRTGAVELPHARCEEGKEAFNWSRAIFSLPAEASNAAGSKAAHNRQKGDEEEGQDLEYMIGQGNLHAEHILLLE